MKQYWENLSTRDRWALVIGGACLLIYLFYILVLSAVWEALEEKDRLHTEKYQTLAWMKKVKDIDTTKKPIQKTSNAELLSILSSQLKNRAFQAFPFQLLQTGNGDIQITFESVSFNDLMNFLYGLNQKYQFEVKQLNAQSLETPGLVKLTIILSAK